MLLLKRATDTCQQRPCALDGPFRPATRGEDEASLCGSLPAPSTPTLTLPQGHKPSTVRSHTGFDRWSVRILLFNFPYQLLSGYRRSRVCRSIISRWFWWGAELNTQGTREDRSWLGPLANCVCVGCRQPSRQGRQFVRHRERGEMRRTRASVNHGHRRINVRTFWGCLSYGRYSFPAESLFGVRPLNGFSGEAFSRISSG